MAEAEQRTGGRSDSLVRRMVKSAATPIMASVATAASAYLTRKATELAREKLIPKIQEKGGRAAAKETIESVAGKVAGPAEDALSTITEKVRGEDDSKSREQARRGREQRRNQRKRTMKQPGSS